MGNIKFLKFDINNHKDGYLENHEIAYKQSSVSSNIDIEVLYCGGLASSMSGNKASILSEYFHKKKIPFTIFDYFGHGLSTGEYIRGNIDLWYRSARLVLEQVILKNNNKKVIVIGYSMGGWVALLLAKNFKNIISSVIGLATAPDYTYDLFSVILKKNSIDINEKNLCNKHIIESIFHNQKEIVVEICDGKYVYHVTKEQILYGIKYNVLHRNSSKEKIFLPQTSIFIHGLEDDIVDYKKPLDIVNTTINSNSIIRFIKNANHELNDHISINEIITSIELLIDQ